MSHRVAVIDCGTNSIRLLVADIDRSVSNGASLAGHSDPGTNTGAGKTDVVREMRIVRLGEGVDRTGRFTPAALQRTLEVTAEYGELIAMLGANRIRFCATSAARDASNGEELSAGVRDILGIDLEILSGQAEAEASFLGATRELPSPSSADAVVLDIGGGSTELVAGTDGKVGWSTSLDIGSVRLTERFLAGDRPQVAEITDCIGYLDSVLAPAVARLPQVGSLIGVAGTVTTVAAYVLGLPGYDSEALHARTLAVSEVRQACLSLLQMSVADRRALPFMHPGRADVIGGGALILDRVLAAVQEQAPGPVDQLVVSERDILDGLAWQAGQW